jgi:hypothetical protein
MSAAARVPVVMALMALWATTAGAGRPGPAPMSATFIARAGQGVFLKQSAPGGCMSGCVAAPG